MFRVHTMDFPGNATCYIPRGASLLFQNACVGVCQVCLRVLSRSWRNRLALHAAASVGLRTLLGSKTRCACITSCAYSMHHAHAPPHAHGACTMRMHHLSQRRACRDSIRIAGAGRLREAVDLRFSFAARHPNEYGPQAEGAGPSGKKGTPLR